MVFCGDTISVEKQLSLAMLTFFCINYGDERFFFQFEIIINAPIINVPLASFEYQGRGQGYAHVYAQR